MSLPHYHRTRIAPTPSGFLHMGNAFSALVTVDLARKTGAEILLRIDDLDQPRARKEYVEDVFESLTHLGINWQTGPRNAADFYEHYSQHKRLHLYQSALERLVDAGHVFACTCSRSALQGKPYPGTCLKKGLPIDLPEASWRLDTSKRMALPVKSVDGSITQHNLPSEMQHFVIRRRDGLPAYQVATLVDDVHFEIDLVVRGEDLWQSTLAQLYLASLLEEKRFTETAFHHHQLLHDAEGRKLSKSEGDGSLRILRSNGMNKSDLLNLIAEAAGKSF